MSIECMFIRTAGDVNAKVKAFWHKDVDPALKVKTKIQIKLDPCDQQYWSSIEKVRFKTVNSKWWQTTSEKSKSKIKSPLKYAFC